jgi:menaquinol-cytochrome c reductase iron-sulfur subunit
MGSKYRSPNLDRRSFVKIVTAALGSIMAAVAGLPMIQYFISPALGKSADEEWIPLGSLDNFPQDIPTLFNFTKVKVNGWEKSSQSYGAFVINRSDGEVVVFSDVCTHLSCRLGWNPDIDEFYCPCHAASFYQDGTVKTGPPPRPMDRYEIRLEEGQLFIHLREG